MNQEIIIKLMKQALRNGLVFNGDEITDYELGIQGAMRLKSKFRWDMNWIRINFQELIFTHEFAKAYFGENTYIHWVEGTIDEMNVTEPIIPRGEWESYQVAWQFHLQQLVLEPTIESRINYLNKFYEQAQNTQGNL